MTIKTYPDVCMTGVYSRVGSFSEDHVGKQKGGLRKISELAIGCSDPEHNPPSHYYYESGVYEYTCPHCGAKRIFTVRNLTM